MLRQKLFGYIVLHLAPVVATIVWRPLTALFALIAHPRNSWRCADLSHAVSNHPEEVVASRGEPVGVRVVQSLVPPAAMALG